MIKQDRSESCRQDEWRSRERVSLEECVVVDTPLGKGVAVGQVVYTELGPGSFPMDPREHQAMVDRLVVEGAGQIVMAPFLLYPPAEMTFSVLEKAEE